jgi:D-alanine-D-alanine ligase
MKKNIAIITGGNSSELVISLRSAEQVRKNIDPVKYNTWIVFIREDDWHVKAGDQRQIPLDRENFSFEQDGKKIPFHYAFIAMHGPPGENGLLQKYLDGLGIPYSSSGPESLALTFNKHASKSLLREKGILTADSVLLKKGDEIRPKELLSGVGLPCFIKPNCGGSSFGVSKINREEDLEKAVAAALGEDDEVLLESFISGPELTCGVLKTPSREFLFPVTEIISMNEFFDYEAKYTIGKAEEITPARVDGEIAENCQEISSAIYDIMDCRGLVRIDFILQDTSLYFLELNGIPGMTGESIIPKQIRTLGLTEREIYNLIIEQTAGWQ